MAKKRITKKETKRRQEIRYYIIALLSIAIIIISLFQLGSGGLFLDNLFKNIFGKIPYYFIMIQLVCFFGYMVINAKVLSFFSRYVIGSIFIAIGMMLLFGCIDASVLGLKVIDFNGLENSDLGILQMVIFGLVSQLFGFYGTGVLAIMIIIIGIVIYFMISLSAFIKNRQKNIVEFGNASKEKLSQRQQARSEARLEKQRLQDSKPVINDFFNDEEVNGEQIVVEEVVDESFLDEQSLVENLPQTTVVEELPFDEDVEFDNDKHVAKEIAIKKSIAMDAKDYKLPSFDLLKNPMTSDAMQVNRKYANEKVILLNEFAQNFNLDIKIDKINIGPSVIKFELKLSPGMKVNRITNLEDDMKLALAVKEIRIEAPIPGVSAIGVEIPNKKNTLITLKEVLNDIDYKHENKLVVGLGKDINGRSIYTNLNKMPHLLVAGATGSGKSVCINSIITSILMNAHYNEVKLLLIDPKKVELNTYNGLPHLLAPVVSDPKSASILLRKVVDEMDERYSILHQHNCKDIESYNKYVEKFNDKTNDDSLRLTKLPYIVVIIDELADLMMVSPKEVEECIMRITQLARAAGIHLIVATQRPSTDVITGLIKANIPSRIAFAVSSSIDSRTILDMTGAEKLLGKGDMLFFPAGISSPLRLQGAFLSDDEVNKVVYAIKKQHIHTMVDETFTNLEPTNINGDVLASSDDLYSDAETFVKKQESISTSRLQRQFKIGYNRAANLIDDLEANGIISAQNGSKPRDVLIRDEELE